MRISSAFIRWLNGINYALFYSSGADVLEGTPEVDFFGID